MFLLIGESTELYSHIQSIQGSSIMQFLGTQLSHHEWNGLHFWDLIQPFFMFIVGVAIPFAVANRKKKGDTDQKIFIHALKRSVCCFSLDGHFTAWSREKLFSDSRMFLHSLSVTYLVAFLIMKKSFSFQLIFTLVVLTDN